MIFSLALPATSALCIASHRKAMSHSQSDAEGASVAHFARFAVQRADKKIVVK